MDKASPASRSTWIGKCAGKPAWESSPGRGHSGHSPRGQGGTGEVSKSKHRPGAQASVLHSEYPSVGKHNYIRMTSS